MDEGQLQERIAELGARLEAEVKDYADLEAHARRLEAQLASKLAQPAADVSYVNGGPVSFTRCEDYERGGKVYEMWKLVDGARDIRMSLTKWRRIAAGARTIAGVLSTVKD